MLRVSHTILVCMMVTLLYTWHWHNTVYQLYFNLKIKVFTKPWFLEAVALLLLLPHALSGRHYANDTFSGAFWLSKSILYTKSMIKLSKAKPIKLAWNNLRGMDLTARMSKGLLHCLCGLTLKLLCSLIRNHWCQTVFSFTNKRLGKGNVPQWCSGKESACNAGDPDSTPGSGKSPGGGYGNPLQYPCLKNSMDRGACQATVHGVPKSRTQRSHGGMFTSCSYALDVGMMFVSTRDWATNHHKLCWDQRGSETLSIQAPLLLRVCAQLPLQFPSLCPSEHSSTQPSLTLGLRLSPSERRWFLYCMWLQNLCGFPSRWASWFSGVAVGLLQDIGHTRKERGTQRLNKCSLQSQKSLLKESLGHPSGSLSLHGFVLGKL